jgi:perosamine synthetase
MDFIPVCEPYLDGNEEKYVLEALTNGWISSSGKYVSQLEDTFAKYCGVKQGIAVCNGTVALHVALTALGVGKGDEVIIPDFNGIYGAFAVCYTGAMPVFVDAEPDTWNMDPDKIEEKITNKTKAVMVVHIYGHPTNMEKIWEISRKYDLKILEDAAEVHGAEYNGRKCGSLGDISIFSFYANKIATSGEGGMILTNDDELADRCRYYKNLCFPLKGPRNYIHNDIGYNYRMSNIIAAIALAQIEKLDEYVELRRKNNRTYKKYLNDVPGIIFQPEKAWAKNVYWMNAFVIDSQKFKVSRDDLMRRLFEKGVETRCFFAGMHRQPSLSKYGCDCSADYPVSDWLSDNGLYLPSSSQLTEEQIKYICNLISYFT